MKPRAPLGQVYQKLIVKCQFHALGLGPIGFTPSQTRNKEQGAGIPTHNRLDLILSEGVLLVLVGTDSRGAEVGWWYVRTFA